MVCKNRLGLATTARIQRYPSYIKSTLIDQLVGALAHDYYIPWPWTSDARRQTYPMTCTPLTGPSALLKTTLMAIVILHHLLGGFVPKIR